MSWQFFNRSCRHGQFDLASSLLSLAFAVFAVTTSADSATVTIAEAWGNLEAGTNAEFHAVIQSSTATRGNLQFAVTVGPQPIVHREIEVTVEAWSAYRSSHSVRRSALERRCGS